LDDGHPSPDPIAEARRLGQTTLSEPQGRRLLERIGIAVPRHLEVPDSRALTAEALAPLRGTRAVVKVVSPAIRHKSDVEGVVVVSRDPAAVSAALRDMETRLAGRDVRGFRVEEFIGHPERFGHELLVSARWTDDFGPILVLGAGGILSEFLAAQLRPDRDLAILSARPGLDDGALATLRNCAAGAAALTGMRGRDAPMDAAALLEVMERLRTLALERMPHDLRELEMNPLVVGPDGPVALDVLATLGDGTRPEEERRPRQKLRNLLEPRSIALMGVSTRMNPGRTILRNLLRDGFPRDALHVVKPGTPSIDGVPCVPDLASLPGRVDLAVISVDAARAVETLLDLLEHERAESVILIPGGFEEKQGTGARVGRLQQALRASRLTPWQGPLINGGNSLGIRSGPGGYDTLFIPSHKLGIEAEREAPLALLSQSGAFAIARNSNLAFLRPRYIITTGNQMDLTLGDHLEYLKDDPAVEVFAVYSEGFRPGDGERFLSAAREIVADGRTVVFYGAGRTGAGAEAAASHTAAIAGDHRAARSLLAAAGVRVAGTLDEFEDLVMAACLLRGRGRPGPRVGAVSNAGFECVAMADNVGGLQLPGFAPDTVERIRETLEGANVGGVVDVHNPMDLTPMMGEEGFEEVVGALLADPGLDAVVVGCVPLTPALETLSRTTGHGEDVEAEGSLASRLVRLGRDQAKPLLAVVDSGRLYDPMARVLLHGGVPVFRTADRALRTLDRMVG